MTDTDSEGEDAETRRAGDETPGTTAAERDPERAVDRLMQLSDDRDAVVELLTESTDTGDRAAVGLRVAASGALAAIAHDTPESLVAHLSPVWEELRATMEAESRADDRDRRAASRAIWDRLVRTIARVVIAQPDTASAIEPFEAFVRAVTTDLTDATLEVATQALFASAAERSSSLAAASGHLRQLLEYENDAVVAWVVASLGRLAEQHPDAAAPAGADIGQTLERDDETVRHNAVEALATLAGERPDAVAPTADWLRTVLDSESVAIQHNAAGALAELATAHPDVVVPAVADLASLRHHDETAVQQRATVALARLARERPDLVDP